MPYILVILSMHVFRLQRLSLIFYLHSLNILSAKLQRVFWIYSYIFKILYICTVVWDITNNSSVNVNFIILICKCSSLFLLGKQFITSIHSCSRFENILWECHTHTYIYPYIKAPVSFSYDSLCLPKAPPSWFPVIFNTHVRSTDLICVACICISVGHALKHERPSRAITSK